MNDLSPRAAAPAEKISSEVRWFPIAQSAGI
jgi:hypothetical protein